MFANDGIPFRTKMLARIEHEFSDLLGDRKRLLGRETGLIRLAGQIDTEISRPRSSDAA
ncbi:MAG: hypothetical protein WKF77_20530 [Planctomycetaceae bacterium]